ncbi:glycoside hydrolase family 57 protein [Marinilabilia rubra]|uniref:Alpha-amylase n=1 Tax=Marinilabilia rubra TaxID=2162893 RepID=A0A2U2BEI3_9BACT|nr:glycoside hydrolase family 57 protein [Marinilabilia rubra]PWE01480.1 alpha-amylase [Marinilabilia rubra]
MQTICLYFQVHQPFRLKSYRFFDIGNDHYYYDDYTNESILNKVATNCYLPTNQLLLKLIKQQKGDFKITFSISGVAIEQFKLYAPEVLSSFRELAQTGMVEFLAETYSHSLVALKDSDEFIRQVKKHADLIEENFGIRPGVFRNTELIYSNQIGNMVANMGYKTMLTEGAPHILNWRSPDYLYHGETEVSLNLLLKNYKLSDDIAFRFGDMEWSEWPLSPKKYVRWLLEKDQSQVINLFMDYETFGEHQEKHTGIFNFLKNFPVEALKTQLIRFTTPSEISKKLKPVAPLNVKHPISWADEERDLTAWLGNEMQQEAFNKLYSHLPEINNCDDPLILKDWELLQCSDHFYYMCTKFNEDGDVHAYFNPYSSPYKAFINYMNILNDFSLRLASLSKKQETDNFLNELITQLTKKELDLDKIESELDNFRKNLVFNKNYQSA